MRTLLAVSRLIDGLNERVGRSAYWLILVMVIISTLNALSRKLLNISSNAFLEIQWYLFAAVFLLCSGYTLLRNEHVRIDVISSRFGRKAQIWIEILGTVVFLFPLTLIVLYDAWPYFLNSFSSGEWSTNPGGLIVWPAKLLIPIGFMLLLLQGLSQLIKLAEALRSGRNASGLLKHHTPAEDAVALAATEPKKNN